MYRSEIILSSLTPIDLVGVISLHYRCFPTSRSTKLGKPYLKKMFTWFITFQPDLSLVAKIDEKVVGYVIGAVGGYGRKLFRYAFFEIILGLITHPRLFVQRSTFVLWRSYLKGIVPQLKTIDKVMETPVGNFKSAALAGICVDPEKQGMGIGKDLMMMFESTAKDLKLEKLTLSAHMDNFTARQLYESCGWHSDNEDPTSNSVHYTKSIVDIKT